MTANTNNSFSIPYKMATLQEVQAAIDSSVPVAFDTETKGLYGKICLAQFYQPHWPEAMLVHMPCQVTLAAMLNACDYHWLMYNGAYD